MGCMVLLMFGLSEGRKERREGLGQMGDRGGETSLLRCCQHLLRDSRMTWGSGSKIKSLVGMLSVKGFRESFKRYGK